jgi:hypothetical protein
VYQSSHALLLGRTELPCIVEASKGPKGEAMDIKRSGSQPSSKGPAEWFTGDVTRLLACTLHTCEYRDTHDSDLNGVDSPKLQFRRRR